VRAQRGQEALQEHYCLQDAALAAGAAARCAEPDGADLVWFDRSSQLGYLFIDELLGCEPMAIEVLGRLFRLRRRWIVITTVPPQGYPDDSRYLSADSLLIHNPSELLQMLQVLLQNLCKLVHRRALRDGTVAEAD